MSFATADRQSTTARPVVVAFARAEHGALWLGTFCNRQAAVYFLFKMLALPPEALEALARDGQCVHTSKYQATAICLVETLSVKLGSTWEQDLPTPLAFQTLPSNA